MTLDIDYLRTWIGRSMTAEDCVTGRLVAEYEATLQPYLAPVPEGAAPLAFHWCLAPSITPMAALGSDGHAAKGEFLPPVPLPRRMWAGGSISSRVPLMRGDQILRRSVIADITAKEGRSGSLCFVGVDHEYWAAGEIALVERHDIVYRAPAGPAAAPAIDAPPRPPMPAAELVWQIAATPTLLFRYSALTFNGHRIHYDMPYATGVEAYPGLVVHGPLQASLMFNLAASLIGETPALFRYRGVSPLIADQIFSVCGTRLPDGSVRCWTQNAAGETTMEATGTTS